MALANVSNQILRSDGGSATVAVNSPLTGNGSQQLPLGLDENYHGADGESLTFDITDIENGHQVTISGIQGSSSFNVLNGQDGANGVNGVNGADGQSVTFDITNITNGHRVTLSGAQGSASFDVLNGQDGVDGVSPTFRFVENEDGVTVIVSGAQGEDSFTLYNATGEGSSYSAGSFIDIYDVDGQKYISANVSAGTPWLSGWKEIGTLSLNFGDSVQIVSSHDFSGFHNHAIGLKGAVVTLPSTAHIGSALDDKLDASSFNNFISTEYSTAKSDIYNSASYLMQNKLDKSESGNFYPMTGNPSGFLTAHQDITNLPYVQNSALNYTPSTLVSGISGNALYAESANHAFTAETANYVEGGWEYDSENHISSYNGSAFVGQNQATYDVTAGANIDVTTAGNTFGISGKDWTDTITAASAYAASQAQGKTYTGVAPIVVNNNEDKISADCARLSAVAPLNMTDEQVGNVMYTKLSANCIELSAGNGIDSNKLATGVIEVSATGGAANIVPMLYGTIKFSAVHDTLDSSGIVIPYEQTQGYTTVYSYVGSGISGTTSSYHFQYIQSNGYYTDLVVSSDANSVNTGVNKHYIKAFATPSEAECKVVIVATSGDIPASGATDNKLYVVTGT